MSEQSVSSSLLNTVQRIMQWLQEIAPARTTLAVVTLYTRANCPLCEEAESVIESVYGRHGVQIVDIAGDRVLEDLYVFRVPVLVAHQTVIAEGRITRADVERARRRLTVSPPALES